jgi:hypothetical protein
MFCFLPAEKFRRPRLSLAEMRFSLLSHRFEVMVAQELLICQYFKGFFFLKAGHISGLAIGF